MPPEIPPVALVGAGPGDPGLITVRGREALERAEVVVFDHLVHPALLDLAPAGCERIYAGKRAGRMALRQEEINALLVDRARAGLRVVRLKGGDPSIFGRGPEEAEHLRGAGVPYRIVPGVTAAVAVAAYAEVPITHRGCASAVALVTGHDDPAAPGSRVDWAELARFPGTLVVYMGVAHLEALARTLTSHGLDPATPAALVERASWPRQRTIRATLGTIATEVAAAGVGAPALLVVGDAAGRRPDRSWFEALPLFGQRVVVTRPTAEAAAAAADLEALGAEALVAPMVAIAPLDDVAPLDDALARLDSFDWLVLASCNGVRALLDRLDATGRDLRALASVRIAAIGPGTAEELARHRLRADLVPERFRSEELAEALAREAAGLSVLLIRADRGRDVLRESLEGVAATVEQVAAYRNVDAPGLPASVLARIGEGSVDWVTLTSPAITRRLHAALDARGRAQIAAGRVRLASLSPVTTAAAAELGWQIAAEAATFTWPGLVAALVEACRGSETDQANSR